MNNRLTIQDLAGLLAGHTGKDKAVTERFLREFIELVSEGVYTDKIVKVKGLGIFKVIPVEKRESIHVNTGERFLIPEHYKFSFLPDKELRELVNKPFSFFETTELSEDAGFADLDVSEEPEEPEEKDTEDESSEEAIPEVILPVAYENLDVLTEISPVEMATPAPEIEHSKSEEPLLPPVVSERHQLHFKRAGERKSRSKKKIGMMVCFIVILLAGANILIYLNRGYFMRGNKSRTEVVKESVRVLLPDTVEPEVTVSEEPDSVVGKTAVKDSVPVQPAPEVKTEAAASPDVIARVKIGAGSRLTLIAREYYGSKHFWVYIYMYNKSKIKDPNNVPIGTVVEIPAPRLYGIDARNRASVEKATSLQTEILSGR